MTSRAVDVNYVFRLNHLRRKSSAPLCVSEYPGKLYPVQTFIVFISLICIGKCLSEQICHGYYHNGWILGTHSIGFMPHMIEMIHHYLNTRLQHYCMKNCVNEFVRKIALPKSDKMIIVEGSGYFESLKLLVLNLHPGSSRNDTKMKPEQFTMIFGSGLVRASSHLDRLDTS